MAEFTQGVDSINRNPRIGDWFTIDTPFLGGNCSRGQLTCVVSTGISELSLVVTGEIKLKVRPDLTCCVDDCEDDLPKQHLSLL